MNTEWDAVLDDVREVAKAGGGEVHVPAAEHRSPSGRPLADVQKAIDEAVAAGDQERPAGHLYRVMVLPCLANYRGATSYAESGEAAIKCSSSTLITVRTTFAPEFAALAAPPEEEKTVGEWASGLADYIEAHAHRWARPDDWMQYVPGLRFVERFVADHEHERIRVPAPPEDISADDEHRCDKLVIPPGGIVDGKPVGLRQCSRDYGHEGDCA